MIKNDLFFILGQHYNHEQTVVYYLMFMAFDLCIVAIVLLILLFYAHY